ncbi:MAG TPA: hypothetical protein VIK16_05815, partial [Candidatus Limnocylindrales bacterium]
MCDFLAGTCPTPASWDRRRAALAHFYEAGIDADAAEDGGERDEHDTAVEPGHEDPERRVGERDPAVVDMGEPPRTP